MKNNFLKTVRDIFWLFVALSAISKQENIIK